MGFQIVFNISKIKKTLQTDWPNTFLPTTWEAGFEEMFLVESQRQLTMVHHLTLKKAHIDGSIFFSKSILLIYFRALLDKLD